jgi:hypothetical protein
MNDFEEPMHDYLLPFIGQEISIIGGKNPRRGSGDRGTVTVIIK